MPKHLAYLGPPGTFTEEAALLYNPEAQLRPLFTVSAVATAVVTGLADEGVVAIENSLEGSVNDTLDLLIRESRLAICRELTLPIVHCLLSRRGTRAEEIQVIYSHPSALGQCRGFIEEVFPRAQAVAALSTTAAVEQMLASSAPAGAIGPRRASQLYGAEVLVGNILKDQINVTRFVVLAQEDHPPTGRDKTSLCVAFSEDRSGLLYSVLGEFAHRNINLTKVESRPSRESLGRYVFLVDLQGHREDLLVKEALAAVSRQASLFKIFGSYPQYEGGG